MGLTSGLVLLVAIFQTAVLLTAEIQSESAGAPSTVSGLEYSLTAIQKAAPSTCKDSLLEQIALECAKVSDFENALKCLAEIQNPDRKRDTAVQVAEFQKNADQEIAAIETLEVGTGEDFMASRARADFMSEAGLVDQAEPIYVESGLEPSPVFLVRKQRADEAFDVFLKTYATPAPTNDELSKIGLACVKTRQFQALKDGYRKSLGERAELGLVWLVLHRLSNQSEDEFDRILVELELSKRFPILAHRRLFPLSLQHQCVDARTYAVICEFTHTPELECLIGQAAIHVRDAEAAKAHEVLKAISTRLPDSLGYEPPDLFSGEAEVFRQQLSVVCLQSRLGDTKVLKSIHSFGEPGRLSESLLTLGRLVGASMHAASLGDFVTEASRIGLPPEVTISMALSSEQEFSVLPTNSLWLWQQIELGRGFEIQLHSAGIETLTAEQIPLFCGTTSIEFQQDVFRELNMGPEHWLRTSRILRFAPKGAIDREVVMNCLASSSPKVVLNAMVHILATDLAINSDLVRNRVIWLKSHANEELDYAADQILKAILNRNDDQTH